MICHYNSRPGPANVQVSGGKCRVIQPRETEHLQTV